MSYLYVIRCNEYSKIGITNDVESRLAALQTGNPYQLAVECCYEFENAMPVEQSLHQRFSHKCQNGEWFRFTTDDLGTLQRICELLGGKQIHSNQVASESDVEDADVAADAAEPETAEQINAMLEDGWRIETWSKIGKSGQTLTYWAYAKRGAAEGKNGGRRLRLYGGTWKSLPQVIKDRLEHCDVGGKVEP